MDNYKRGEEWNAFNHIVEFSPTGINGVHAAAEHREMERYDTSGRRLTSPHQGPQHCALQRWHHEEGDEIIFQTPTLHLKGADQSSDYKQNSLLVPE